MRRTYIRIMDNFDNCIVYFIAHHVTMCHYSPCLLSLSLSEVLFIFVFFLVHFKTAYCIESRYMQPLPGIKKDIIYVS